MDINQAYRLLKLDPDASPEVVRRRYHELAARWHPDLLVHAGPSKDHASEKMKELNLAYELIRRYWEKHILIVCPQCGAENRKPADLNIEYAACRRCGKQLQRPTPRQKRVPCGNERCAGTIGSNGCCNYCGKTVAEGRKSSLAAEAAESGGRFARSRSFGRSAARIARTLFLVVIACGSVAAAYLYYQHRSRSAEPTLSVRDPSVAAPPARESPQPGEPRRAFFQAPAPAVVPEHSFYLDLFRRGPLPKEEVIRLQRMLKTIGYAVETVDGAAGKNTAACLRHYSVDFGYLPTDRFPHCFFEHAALHYHLALEHPDWLDIFLSGDVGNWADAQPEHVRREIYTAACEQANAAVQLVRRYKFDRYRPLPKLLPETKILGSTYSGAAVSLRIRTPAGRQHYLIRLVTIEERREAAFAFIRSGSSLTFRLPFGIYELKYASGETWFGPEFLFGTSARYGRLQQFIRLTEKECPTGRHTIDLNPDSSDALAVERISEFEY